MNMEHDITTRKITSMKLLSILITGSLFFPLQLMSQSGLNISDGSGVSNDGYLTIGSEDGSHLAFATSDIQSKAADDYTTLYLNYYGGNIIMGSIFQQTNVGIRTSVPTSALHVSSSEEARLTKNGAILVGNHYTHNLVLSATEIQARSNGLAAPLTLNQDGGTILAPGLVNIGDWKDMQYNDVTGEIGWDNSSRRYKINIQTLEDDWSKIFQARPVRYSRPASPNHWEYGYIAEEMDSIGLTNLVGYDQAGIPDDVKYDRVVLYLVEIAKNQEKEIRKLTAQIAELRNEISHHEGHSSLRH